MKNILNIVRKELKKVFQDKRMIFSIIILPGLMLFAIYSIMGSLSNSLQGQVEEHKSIVYIKNESEKFKEMMKDYNLELKENFSISIEEIKSGIYSGTIDLYIEFTPKTPDKREEVILFYNAGENNSVAAYNKLSKTLVDYNKYLQGESGVEPDLIIVKDPQIIVDSKKANAKALGYIIPMMVVIFTFASALSVSAESIAGEKERNTIATLLVTPVKRSEVILGKTFACLLITMCSSVSSFIGLIASMPFMGSMFGQVNVAALYGFFHYIGIFLVIILIALYGVVMILATSVYAKNIKEANALAMPIYFLGIFLPLFAGMQEKIPNDLVTYLIPFYNSVVSLKGLISLDLSLTQLLLTFGSSIVYISLLIFLLAKLFKKENILFRK